MPKVAKSKKKVISVMLTDVSPYELEGTLGEVQATINRWITEHGIDSRLNWDPDYWPQYNDSPSPRYEIKINREETDEEFDKRIKHEALQQSQQEARELAELERLQKKFAGKK